MPNVRVTPPRDGLHNTATVNGRTYTGALGATLDVPDFDALILMANGWTAIPNAQTYVGPTSARPTTYPDGRRLEPGYTYLDTTVGLVTWDGSVWRSISGAAV